MPQIFTLDDIKETLREKNQIKLLNEITKQTQKFRKSPIKIFCADCGIIFYEGYARILESEEFLEFKMLAFRHVWDTRHEVKVEIEFFKGHGLYRFLDRFDVDDRLSYSVTVENFRESLRLNYDPRTHQTNDKNWDRSSTCVCSTCKREYYDPKKACYCCGDTKPWMPWKEVETINISPTQIGID